MHWQEGGGRLLWGVLAVLVAGGAVLSLQPWRERDPDKIWKQGEADLNAARFDAAEAAVARLKRIRKPTPEDLLLQAQVHIARERRDEALRVLALVPDDAPMAAQARLMAGRIELRRGKLGVAERNLREAARLDPKLVPAHRELIYIYGMLLRRRELDAEFRALSELTPLTFENLFHWTLTRSTNWEPRELRGDLEGFLKAEPGDRSTRLALGECLRRLGFRDEADATLSPLPDTDAEARAIRVRVALDRGDDLKAESLLKEGPADIPELARLRGKLALARGDAEAALRDFRRAYAAEPDNRDTLSGMTGALKQLGKDEEAAKYMEAARRQDVMASLTTRAALKDAHNDLQLIARLGDASEALGRLHEARSWYQLIIARDPLNASAQQALFRIKAKLEKQSSASETSATSDN